jgi:hypothetical protein
MAIAIVAFTHFELTVKPGDFVSDDHPVGPTDPTPLVSSRPDLFVREPVEPGELPNQQPIKRRQPRANTQKGA